MLSNVSEFVSENLSVINAACDPRTTSKITTHLLKTASQRMVLAIEELLLNIKEEKLPKVILAIRKKGLKLKRKRQLIVKYWKKIRSILAPVIQRLLKDEEDGKTKTKNGNVTGRVTPTVDSHNK